MQLSRYEEEALDGKYGDTVALAYRVLVAIGNAIEADRLIDISWAHVSGVNYNTIGDAGLRFLEDISREGIKVKVKTTLNPMGYDRGRIEPIISDTFIERQERILDAYSRLGVTGIHSCTPYDRDVFPDIPPTGSQVSLAESNAAIYANSMLGLLTNKESAISALASAITGKAPYSNLRLQERRYAKVCIDVRYDIKDELDYGLLGYYAGKLNEECIALNGIEYDRLTSADTKALCSALGTSGSTGMFILKSIDAKERHPFDRSDAIKVKDELSDADDGDIIVFGSPQLGLDELSSIIDRLNGRRFKKRCMIFCARSVYSKASRLGYIDALEKANATVYSGCCSCLTPLISKASVDSVITNSVKAAYYLRSWNKVGVCMRSMRSIIDSESV
jgi:predicted aconitase